MNKAIVFLILLSFVALGAVAFYYYFYFEGKEEVIGTFAKVPQSINFKTLVGKNLSEETLVLPDFEMLVGNGFCDDRANHALYEYDGGDCCQPFLNIATCYQCKCHKDPDRCPNNALQGDGHCQPGLDIPECDYDGGDCGKNAFLFFLDPEVEPNVDLEVDPDAFLFAFTILKFQFLLGGRCKLRNPNRLVATTQCDGL